MNEPLFLDSAARKGPDQRLRRWAAANAGPLDRTVLLARQANSPGHLGGVTQLVDVQTRRDQVHLVGADVLEQPGERFLVGPCPSSGGHGE